MTEQARCTVRDAPDRSRYEIVDGDEVVGFADYTVDGATMTISHVEVTPARRGESLGAHLVREVLDDVRARGLTVRPLCPFVQVYLRGHREYQDLLVTA